LSVVVATLKTCAMPVSSWVLILVRYGRRLFTAAALLSAILLSACAATNELQVADRAGSTSSIAPITSLEILSTESLPTTYAYNHASTIIEAANGDLLTAWGAGSEELADDCVIVLSRKRPGETTWSEPIVVADKPGYADANPVLLAGEGDELRLFYVEMFGDSFCLGRVMERVSRDHGLTWGPPRDALKTVCTMIRNHILITRSGRWVMPAYQQAIYQSQFLLSEDRGATWSATGGLLTPSANNLQPAVVELSDGSLYALMRTGGGNNETWEGRSTDGGRTWKLGQRPELPNPNSGLDLIRLSGGQLVLAYNPSKTERTPLSVSISNDEGRTWSAPQTIEDGEAQLSYPSLWQSSDGAIHLTYSQRLQRIRHVELRTGDARGAANRK